MQMCLGHQHILHPPHHYQSAPWSETVWLVMKMRSNTCALEVLMNAGCTAMTVGLGRSVANLPLKFALTLVEDISNTC